MAKTYPPMDQPVKMKSAIRNLWLDLLVSNQYEQTQSVLSNSQGFCCLGVLCDIHSNVAPEKVRESWIDGQFNGEYCAQYGGETEMLSLRIGRWAFPELKAVDQGAYVWNDKKATHVREFPDTPSGRAEMFMHMLANMNDDGCSFQKIAKYIEANTVGV